MAKKKESKYSEPEFLEMFREVKGREKGRKATTRKLVGRTEGNFRKLVSAGYEPDEFEKAATAMFRDPGQWAVSTGNDTPEHLLQPDNFSRYLNAAENPQKKKDERPVLNQQQEPQKYSTYDERVKREDEAELDASKKVYSDSLKEKKWIGKIGDAMRIGPMFTNSFTLEEKLKFEEEGRLKCEKESDRRTGSAGIAEMLERIARTYPRNVMFELVVIEAVKRKIQEPWGN